MNFVASGSRDGMAPAGISTNIARRDGIEGRNNCGESRFGRTIVSSHEIIAESAAEAAAAPKSVGTERNEGRGPGRIVGDRRRSRRTRRRAIGVSGAILPLSLNVLSDRGWTIRGRSRTEPSSYRNDSAPLYRRDRIREAGNPTPPSSFIIIIINVTIIIIV